MTYDQWYEQLSQQPDDWELRLVFADWLEDQGEVTMAQYQRWATREKVCPEKSDTVSSEIQESFGWIHNQNFSWDWWCSEKHMQGDHIPLWLQDALQDGAETSVTIRYRLKEFPSVEVAEQKLLFAMEEWSRVHGLDWFLWTVVDGEWRIQ